MKKIIFLLLVCVTINISIVNAAETQVKVGDEYYWYGNTNYLVRPLSSGSSGRFVALDLTSISIKENTKETVCISMLSYFISPTGEVEDKAIYTLRKENSINGYFEENGRKIAITPIIVNAYYGLAKEIEKHTNGKIKSADILGGYVCRNEKYIWLIPKVPPDKKKDYGIKGDLSIFGSLIPQNRRKELSVDIVITPLYLFYVRGIGKKDVFEKRIDKHYAKTLDGKWIVIQTSSFAEFAKNRGAFNNNNWKEIPYGVLGEITEDICNFSEKYIKTGKY